MNLKVTRQTDTGLNTEFVNLDTGRHVSLKQAIDQINKGNPRYDNYTTVTNPNKTIYIRSKPDHSKKTTSNN